MQNYFDEVTVTPKLPIEEGTESSEFHIQSDETIEIEKIQLNPLSKPFEPKGKMDSDTITPPLSSDSEVSSINSNVSDELEKSYSTSSDSNEVKNKVKYEDYECFLNDEEEEYVCLICYETFHSLEDLQKHFSNKVHLPHTCDFCGVAFEHKFSLDRHQKMHPSTKKSIKCRGCSKKFRSLNQLAKHFENCRFNSYMFI